MAEQQAEKKTEPTITGAKIALVGTISAALIGAATAITVALLQHTDSAPKTGTWSSPVSPWSSPNDSEVFSELSIQDGVHQVLSDDYKLEVSSVNCPSGQPVRVGSTFDCTASIDGQPRRVPITVETADGQYQVGEPQ